LSAQITQELITQLQADKLIIEHLTDEIKLYTLYAKEGIQKDFRISTTSGEICELDYMCFVYYVNFTDEIFGKYLIVKVRNGNKLEINTSNDEGPNDLTGWRIVDGVPSLISIEEYSLEGSSCQWKYFDSYIPEGKYFIVKSNEELELYMNCTEVSYPEIDFSRYSLLLTYGASYALPPMIIGAEYFENGMNKYSLNLTIFAGLFGSPSHWSFAFIVPKIEDEDVIILYVTYY